MKKIILYTNLLLALSSASAISPIYGSDGYYGGSGRSYQYGYGQGGSSQGGASQYDPSYNQGGSGYRGQSSGGYPSYNHGGSSQGGSSQGGSSHYDQNYGQGGTGAHGQSSGTSPTYGQGGTGARGQSSGTSPTYGQGGSSYSKETPQGYPPSYGQGGSSYSRETPQGYPPSYGQGGSSYSRETPQSYPPRYGQGGSSYSRETPQGYPPSRSSGEPSYPKQNPQGYPPTHNSGESAYSRQPTTNPSHSSDNSSYSGQPVNSYPSSGSTSRPSQMADGTNSPNTPSPNIAQRVKPPIPPRPAKSTQQPEINTRPSSASQLPPGPSSLPQQPQRPSNPTPHLVPGPVGKENPPLKPNTDIGSDVHSNQHPSSGLPAPLSSPTKAQGLLTPTQHGRKIMSDITSQQKELGDTGLEKRLDKRSDARKLQKQAKDFQANFAKVMEYSKFAGKGVTALASATGDPNAKMGAAALNVALVAVEELGDGIAKLVIGVARFQERSQEILSNTEVLLEGAQKSLDIYKTLKNSEKQLLDVGKTPQPSQSSSAAKRVGRDILNIPTKVKNSALDLTDPFTNEKAHREKKLQVIHEQLRSENDKFTEIIKLMQIKILQDSIKEIDRKIKLPITISALQLVTGDFYKASKDEIVKKNKRVKKELAKLEEKNSRSLKELKYYQDYEAKPTETPEELKKDKEILINEIGELTRLTALGNARYLQEKGLDIRNSQTDLATIAAIYRDIDDLKTEIDNLTTELEAVKENVPNSDK